MENIREDPDTKVLPVVERRQNIGMKSFNIWLTLS
jgi:hypothetical protein